MTIKKMNHRSKKTQNHHKKTSAHHTSHVHHTQTAAAQKKHVTHASSTHRVSKKVEIKRKLLAIKNDYAKLIRDMAMGYGLIKNWIGVQALNKRDLLRSRLVK